MELLEKFLFLYKSKYRRKLKIDFFILIAIQYFFLYFLTTESVSYECGGLDSCENGVCVNNSCLCNPGWTGQRCQFCSGKIRLTKGHGWLSDGDGNYTSNMKCTWLIESHSIQKSKEGGSNKSSPIYIHFEEFATECGWDHLYIYDGDSVNAPLLGVFSGLLVQKNYKVLQLPEVIARSGYALLHFYTDVAYNLTGFNISYRTNSCPSSYSSLECSGNGVCLDGICTCNAGYMGDACNLPMCPNNCSGTGTCSMEMHKCLCNEGYGGADCSQEAKYGVWEALKPSAIVPTGSASHSSVIHNDSLWVIGGSNLNLNAKELIVMRYSFKDGTWENIVTKGNDIIPSVYSHSCVLFENKIYLYGGVQDGKFGTRYVSNSVWSLDLNTRVWSKPHVRHGLCKSLMCGPIHLAGHSAVVINDKGNKSRHSKMVVIFGHSPRYGYVNIVQEFHFGSENWNIVNTKGYPVGGSYGHTSTWDPMTQRIYVFGGYRIGSDSGLLSNLMHSYDPVYRSWDLLSAAPGGRFLHSAVVFKGLMLVFGGNGHNDTVYSLGSKCFTNEVLAYDILCDTWSSLDPPNSLPADVSRYGHTSVSFNSSIYLYGGFNGMVLNDLVRFTPGLCNDIKFNSSQSCLNSVVHGLKCQWNKTIGTCEDVASQLKKDRERDQDLTSVETCPGSVRRTDVNACDTFKSCSACVQNKMDCVWCGNHCHFSKCKDSKNKALVSLEQCPNTDEGFCGPLMHNCHLCSSEPSCVWSKDELCVKDSYRNSSEIGVDKDPVLCEKSCNEHVSCYNCTADHCMWCNNLNKCVDKNAYVISFPYGQCMSWSQAPNLCLTKKSLPLTSSMCDEVSSCDSCRQIPSCGWCDNGAGTGLGRCMDGSGRGPMTVNITGAFLNNTVCPSTHWYFTECPACQCNGHSVCDEKNRCLSCEGFTEGERCETCISGYHGKSVNGGECKLCECNNHAETCHHETGKCFCTTKGITGDHCERCDTQNNYAGDPSNGGSCFYELQIDYQFTFNLSKKEDRYFSQINFRNSPSKLDVDAEFEIYCSIPAKMNLTVKKVGSSEVPLLTAFNCTTYKTRFDKTDHNFGTSDNTTFYVYVYDFKSPLLIRISFSQSPKLDLLHFFVTFSLCFLGLLLVAAVLWKLKQKYDMYRRRQRLFVEMEQMASRPFAQVYVELGKSFQARSVTSVRKRKKEFPSPIALEPCQGNRAAVLSLLITMPTGSTPYAPPGQTGLSVGSTLVALGNPRKVSFEPITKTDGKNSKMRKSLPSHSLNTCI